MVPDNAKNTLFALFNATADHWNEYATEDSGARYGNILKTARRWWKSWTAKLIIATIWTESWHTIIKWGNEAADVMLDNSSLRN
jgi:hypothetical protein